MALMAVFSRMACSSEAAPPDQVRAAVSRSDASKAKPRVGSGRHLRAGHMIGGTPRKPPSTA